MGPSSDTSKPRANQFLANASHELRTPLNAIVGMLDLSLGEQLSLQLRDYLTTARDSAAALVASLDSLADLAQADVGAIVFDCEPINLAEVLAEAIAPIVARAREVNRSVELRVPLSLPKDVCGDGTRLEQIFLPIVEQVFQTLDAPRIVLDVRIARLGDGEVALEFDVAERVGIAPADRDQFRPLAEADVSKYSAAGLGLTVAARWMTHLQGQLWTDADKHARFFGTLTLPRQWPQRVAPGSKAAPQPSMLHRASKNKGSSQVQSHALMPVRTLRVLVADDTPANQKVVKAVLTKRGHRVELADNGRHALEQLRKQQFDVVLMDAQMPMMNGLQATAAIRDLSDAARSRVPIIALTGHTLQEDRQRCLAAGMNDYLPKPIDIEALIDCVEYHGNAPRVDGNGSLGANAETAVQLQQRPQADPMQGTATTLEQDFLAGALARLGGDEALLRELIRLFQEDAEVLVRRIRKEIAAGDSEAVCRAAHNLRGLSANFDDLRTISAAGAVEQAAKRSELTEALRLVPELEAALDALQGALARY
jgi:CheY-like chemotaxis protein